MVMKIVPFMEDCESGVHGKYQKNTIHNGFEAWLPMCPRCRIDNKARRMIKNTKLPPKHKDCSFKNYEISADLKFGPDQKFVLEQCMNYAKKFTGNLKDTGSLGLLGKPGTGKNHLSTAILKYLTRKGFTVLHLTTQDYLDTYWSTEFNKKIPYINTLASFDLIIFNEIDKVTTNKTAQDAIFRILDKRYEEMKPNILVSNFDQEHLKNLIGEYSYDRQKEYNGNLLILDWESHRGKRK